MADLLFSPIWKQAPACIKALGLPGDSLQAGTPSHILQWKATCPPLLSASLAGSRDCQGTLGCLCSHWKALQMAVKRREVKSKREKERYKHLNAEFHSIFPSIRVFSNESALRIRWLMRRSMKYWSFSA